MLANLAVNDANKVAITASSVILRLVRLLGSRSEVVQAQAARALANLLR